MAYSKKQNEQNQIYVKENQKRIEIKYKLDEYENIILPAVTKSGLPLATFIKLAIEEKIKRDSGEI